MSIKAPPARGYEDWQRTASWDSGALFSAGGNIAVGAPLLSGVLDVSRFAYLGGWDQVAGGLVAVTFTWTLDQAGAEVIGSRTIMLDASIAGVAQYRFLNLGPWLSVQWAAVGGPATHAVNLLASNRAGPLELVPVNPWLYSNSAVVIPAGGALVAAPSDYYAGPIDVFTNLTQAGSVALQALDTGGVYRSLATIPFTAGQNLLQPFLAPPGAWRLRVTNASGTTVSTGNVAVTYSNTGAA